MMPPRFPSAFEKQTEIPSPIWISLAHAAALIDTTPKALAMRLSRTLLPPGIVTKLGRRVRLHRQRFLEAVERGL